MCYEIMIVCAVLALITVGMNLVALLKFNSRAFKIVLVGVLIFTACRYITLIVYGDSPSLLWLQRLRVFYFASSVGLPVMMLVAIWYAIPLFREKINPFWPLVVLLPWYLFYGLLLYKQPMHMVKGSQFGYQLLLNNIIMEYFVKMQSCFALIIVGLCLFGIVKYKHLQIRVQLFYILIAQMMLSLDGITYSLRSIKVFPAFTLTEAFAFTATYYTLTKGIKLLKLRD